MEVLPPSDWQWPAPASYRRSSQINDLSDQFGAQCLDERSSASRKHRTSMRSYNRNQSPASCSPTSTQPFPRLSCDMGEETEATTGASTSINMRRRRQRAIRRQCSTHHLLEIQDLVARLVASGDIPDSTSCDRSVSSEESQELRDRNRSFQDPREGCSESNDPYFTPHAEQNRTTLRRASVLSSSLRPKCDKKHKKSQYRIHKP